MRAEVRRGRHCPLASMGLRRGHFGRNAIGLSCVLEISSANWERTSIGLFHICKTRGRLPHFFSAVLLPGAGHGRGRVAVKMECEPVFGA